MATYQGPQAAVFDLDGVVTLTARLHEASWKELFDSYLRERAAKSGEAFRPFDEQEYLAYVDGKPRYDGVRSFLASRGITLPEGEPSDGPDRETVCGLGNRKDNFFTEMVRKMGVDVDKAAVRFIRDLRAQGVAVGLASSSNNAVLVLRRAGLSPLFDAVVDGHVSTRLGLKGKPQPDIFLKCLEELPGQVEPRRAMVLEDAISGVEAGKRGGFGLVVGVDRHHGSTQLAEHGADWVIRDFSELTVERLSEYFRKVA